jgi:hypothetical protein
MRHETSHERVTEMNSWCDMQVRLVVGKVLRVLRGVQRNGPAAGQKLRERFEQILRFLLSLQLVGLDELQSMELDRELSR